MGVTILGECIWVGGYSFWFAPLQYLDYLPGSKEENDQHLLKDKNETFLFKPTIAGCGNATNYGYDNQRL